MISETISKDYSRLCDIFDLASCVGWLTVYRMRSELKIYLEHDKMVGSFTGKHCSALAYFYYTIVRQIEAELPEFIQVSVQHWNSSLIKG